jgi:hypothetical protein
MTEIFHKASLKLASKLFNVLNDKQIEYTTGRFDASNCNNCKKQQKNPRCLREFLAKPLFQTLDCKIDSCPLGIQTTKTHTTVCVSVEDRRAYKLSIVTVYVNSIDSFHTMRCFASVSFLRFCLKVPIVLHWRASGQHMQHLFSSNKSRMHFPYSHVIVLR